MVRYFENPAEGRYFRVELDDDVITIRKGAIGDPDDAGEVTVIDDSFASHHMPADVLFDELAPDGDGYEEALVDDLLDHVERGHGVTLSGRLRRFFAEQEFKAHQGKRCRRLDCVVDFGASCVQGGFTQTYVDEGRARRLIPLSSKWVGDDYEYEEEQQWIGVDADLDDGPVFSLFTSGEFETAFPNLDAFVADLEPLEGG